MILICLTMKRMDFYKSPTYTNNMKIITSTFVTVNKKGFDERVNLSQRRNIWLMKLLRWCSFVAIIFNCFIKFKSKIFKWLFDRERSEREEAEEERERESTRNSDMRKNYQWKAINHNLSQLKSYNIRAIYHKELVRNYYYWDTKFYFFFKKLKFNFSCFQIFLKI